MELTTDTLFHFIIRKYKYNKSKIKKKSSSENNSQSNTALPTTRTKNDELKIKQYTKGLLIHN